MLGYLISLPRTLADIAALLGAILEGQREMKAQFDLLAAKLTKLDEVVPGVVETLTFLRQQVQENKDAPEKIEQFTAALDSSINKLAAALVVKTAAAEEPASVEVIKEAEEEAVTEAEEAVKEDQS